MKKASEVSLIEVNDVVIGVVLGANYTAEHEMGIRPLLQTLNIDPDARFLEGRSMTAPCSERYKQLGYQKTNTYYPGGGKRIKATEKALALVPLSGFGSEADTAKMHGDRYTQDADLAGAWDGREFCLIGWTDKGHASVRLIAEGLEQGDLAVWLGGNGGNPFARSGLVIARTSMVPTEQRETMRQADQAQLDLTAAAEATGIHAKLTKINMAQVDTSRRFAFQERPRGYHALRPRMIDKDEMTKRKTKHPVIFFLNPFAQERYNHGWFTVEDLEQWIAGTGPVLKVAAEK